MIGKIYWLHPENSVPHPHVIIEETDDSVILCAITTNTRKISIQGNILLNVGEANLTKPSIIEVSKMVTILKNQLGDYIGRLDDSRINQIITGIRFIGYFR
mgnify:CR=1 FL=1